MSDPADGLDTSCSSRNDCIQLQTSPRTIEKIVQAVDDIERRDDDSEYDMANDIWNTGQEFENSMDSTTHELTEKKRQRQYQEAAIYLQEGQNNDKFKTHPHSHEALPAYQMAHNPMFHTLDFLAAVCVLLLAAFERPAITILEIPVGVHGSIELLCLLILSIDLGIRLKWLGWRVFFKHKRTVSKGLIILLMLVEAIVVIIRQTNHFRVTRALRPIFLIHTHYCRGVRRIVRQIMQSMPPILDMLLLLLFFMLIFSILAFYLFSDIPNDTYFQTFQDSFVSLFVLVTTANYPDVMMPAYATNQLYSVFFIIYLCLELFFLMNLLLAVVYDTFLNLEKAKVRALYFHKHEGCIHAFRLLATQCNRSSLTVKHFIGMMEYFVPSRTRREYYLMFKSLNTSESGMLSQEEFFNVYNAAKLQWKLKNDPTLWSSHFRHPFNKIFKAFHWLSTWKYFDYLIYVIILGNFITILSEAIRMSSNSVSANSYNFTASSLSIVFVCIYSVEAMIKILGRGPRDYFTKGWDLFDFMVTVISVVGVFGETFEDSFYYVMVLRPFRLLRLFRIKKRYRDVLGTLFVLFNKLISLAICIIIVYYFYAIVGMEIFLDTDLRNCCKNTSVEVFFAYGNNTDTGFYYMNNFNNIFVSGVTLFELTVVNNWFIIMEGYAYGVSQLTRAYFMAFYITMMVVMNIVVAFVLESFVFRINYRRQMKLDDIEDHNTYKEEIGLTPEEMNMVSVLSRTMTGRFIPQARQAERPFIFYGERPQNREDFSLRMYNDEVQTWADEFRSNRQEIIDSMERLRNRSRPNSHREMEDIHVEVDALPAEPNGSFTTA